MTETAIAVRPANMAEQIQLAKLLAESSILPDSYRKQPANLLVAMEAAESLRISLFQAIQGISVIKGKMAMSAELMRALVLRAGHELRVDLLTEDGCRMAAARRERPDDVQFFEFTMADAQRAKLTGADGNYSKYPKSMFLARATSLACRALFPDVVSGIGFDPDELAESMDDRPPTVSTARLRPMPPAIHADEDGVIVDVEDAPEGAES